MPPRSPPLTVSGTVLEESDDLNILRMTFESKLTFEKYLCSVSRAASQRLGILRKSRRVFNDKPLLERSFWDLSYQFYKGGLASRADQRVSRWFGHVERMDEYRIARRVWMVEASRCFVRGRPRLGMALSNRGMTVEAVR